MASYNQEEKRAQYVLGFIFIALAMGIVLTGFGYYRNYEAQYRAQIESQLAAIAELKVAELVQWRTERQADTAIFYGNVAFSNLVARFFKDPQDTDAQQQLQAWLGNYPAHSQYDQVRLLDPQGVTRLSVPANEPPASAAVLQHLPPVLQSGRVTFADFYRHDSDTDRRIYLTIFIPILDQQNRNRAIGVLALRVDPEQYLFPFIQRWPTPSESAETLLLRRDGNDALYLNDLRFQSNAALTLRIPLERIKVPAVRAALGQTGIMEGADYRDVPVIAAARAVPDSPWFLIAKMNTAEVFAPLRARLMEMVVLFGALLFGAGASVGLVWRQQRAGAWRERLAIMEALQESERLLRESQAIAGLGSYVLDLRTGIWSSSAILDTIFGIDATFIRSLEGWSSLVHPEWRERMNDYFANQVLGQRNRFDKEYKIVRHHDGAARWVHGLGELELDAQNQPVKMIGTIIDITARMRAEEEIRRLNTELEQRVVERTAQLQAANKELEAFAYTVSHDLRSPLRAIDGFARILVEDYSDKLDAEGNRVLSVVRTNAQKMDQLITGLLTLSRVTRGGIQFARVDMTALAQTTYREIASPDAQALFTFSVAPLPDTFGDPTLLRQVWSNLLLNAIKYTMPRSERHIQVGCRAENQMNIYFVKDSGVGFNPAYTSKLFGVFQRLHKVEEFEGTGVGLAIVQRIVHRHGGTVWAEAEINQGATFYFALPQKVMTP